MHSPHSSLLDKDCLLLRVGVEISLHAHFASHSTLLEATKRSTCQICMCVDPNSAGLELCGQINGFADVGRPYRAAESIVRSICPLQCIGLVGILDHWKYRSKLL